MAGRSLWPSRRKRSGKRAEGHCTRIRATTPRNGNGIDVFRTNDGRLGWYTYTASGAPIWYVSSVAAKGNASWSVFLHKVTYNGSSNTSTVGGNVRLDFSSSTEACFSWTLNGQSADRMA